MSHRGIAQWDVNRCPHIEKWLYVNNYKENSFLGQLIAMFESEDGKAFKKVFDVMRHQPDPKDAVQYWLIHYEKAPGQAENERQQIAQLTYELYTAQ